MASHPTQNHQKMQLKMHQHYHKSNGAKHRDIDSDELSRYIAILILSLTPNDDVSHFFQLSSIHIYPVEEIVVNFQHIMQGFVIPAFL